MRLMVKVGGSLIEEAAGLARLAAEVQRTLAAGTKVVLLTAAATRCAPSRSGSRSPTAITPGCA